MIQNPGTPGCTIHDLRRTFISHLTMAGVNEAVVQKLAGHASIDTTLKYYTHIFSDVLRKAQVAPPFARIVGLSRADGMQAG